MTFEEQAWEEGLAKGIAEGRQQGLAAVCGSAAVGSGKLRMCFT